MTGQSRIRGRTMFEVAMSHRPHNREPLGLRCEIRQLISDLNPGYAGVNRRELTSQRRRSLRLGIPEVKPRPAT